MSYPPGAKDDSRAPYNEPIVPELKRTIKDIVMDKDGNEFDIRITYLFQEVDSVVYAQVHNYNNDAEIDPAILLEQVQDIIRENHENADMVYFV